MTMDWRRMDQAARDAAYDNGAAVPDGAERVAAWRGASDAVRAARPEHLDLPYDPAPRCRWDLFPARRAAAPCLVFLHGGYWQRREKESFTCLVEGVVAHGWAAALPGYTLAPEASLTRIVAEIGAALDWLSANGAAHGIAGPVILSGWSAGGHLTAAALDHPAVAAGLAISGLFDLEPIRATYLDAALRLTDTEVERLSPIRQRPEGRKPLVVAYGTAELPELRHQSRDYDARRRGWGLSSVLLPLAGENHFTILEQLRSPAGALTAAALVLAAELGSG